METFKLVGHSGCHLEVKEVNGKLVVIKTAKDKAYSERLKKQHEKQKGFRSKSFLTPLPLNSHYNEDGLFEFSMEYINGATLAEHLKKMAIFSIEEIAEKFLSLIPAEYHIDPDAKEIFVAKIKEIQSKVDPTGNPALQKAFETLVAYQWEYCIAGYCHGDMTLENVIWQDGDLYLIDFLDSFYDSWMIDIAKILFDVECLWSYRHELPTDVNLNIRLLIFKRFIKQRVLSLKEGEAVLNTIYHMVLMHLVRIFPYTQDEATRNYLSIEAGNICAIIEAL